MTTVALRGTIGTDGNLRLDDPIPVGLPAGPAEVLVVVQPAAPAAGDKPTTARPLGSARTGLFVDDPALRELDIDAALKEMNDQWKAKLAGVG